MEDAIIEEFSESGQSSATVDGCTLFLQREFFVRAREGVSKMDIVHRLIDSGLLEEGIQLSHQSLRALYRESQEDSKASLPDALLSVLEFGDRHRLNARGI